MNKLKSGIHHISAICSDPVANFNFYTKILGLRFVKKTVNFDDAMTYHLYYGNESGEPGTALTFFPFENIGNGSRGPGQVTKIQFAVPEGSLGFWISRFIEFNVKHKYIEKQFGNSVIRFNDHDDLQLELVMGDFNNGIEAWAEGGIPKEFAIKGFFGAELSVTDFDASKKSLEIFSYKFLKKELLTSRFIREDADNAQYIDILEMKGWPEEKSGYGTVHHIAFSTENDDTQNQLRQKVIDIGLKPTFMIDRKYFHSIYFREFNGILFEIATNEPGFTIDEDLSELGKSLKLPKHFEAMRTQIENHLPELNTDVNSTFGQKSYKFLQIDKGDELIVAFHGTGGDEKSLIHLIEDLFPDASILAVRGNVIQNGLNRYFFKDMNADFDKETIEFEARNLIDNLIKRGFTSEDFKKKYKKISFLGYSNGANFILATMFIKPELFDRAILLHPMFIYKPDQNLKFNNEVIITTGKYDPFLRSYEEIFNLQKELESKGAKVKVFESGGAHEIRPEELEFLMKNLE